MAKCLGLGGSSWTVVALTGPPACGHVPNESFGGEDNPNAGPPGVESSDAGNHGFGLGPIGMIFTTADARNSRGDPTAQCINRFCEVPIVR